MDEILDLNTLFGPLPSASADMTVDALLETMRIGGVARACTLSTLGILLDPQVGNAATRAACAEHAELIPVATLDPRRFFGDPAPIDALRADGACMVRFFPIEQEWPIAFSPFRRLVAAMAGWSAPIMISVNAPGQITALESILADARTPVVLAGVHDGILAEAAASLQNRPTWHVELSQLLGCGSLKLLADCVGPQRMLFGSSAPARPIASAVNTLKRSGIDADGQSAILSGNAKRLLGF